jgi:hypothetical protein
MGWVLVVGIFLLTSGFAFEATRVCVAAELATYSDRESLLRAARWEPGDAATWARLGSLEQWDLEHGNLREAAEYYSRALEVNPHSARHWLETAAIYESLGEISQARHAYENAQFSYPISTQVAWRYGNFLLRQGATSEASAQFRRALLTDPELTESAVAQCWKARHSIPQILDELLPRQNGYYFRAIDSFLQENEVDTALRVWDGLVALKQAFTLPRAISLIRRAISDGRVKDAHRVWQEALEICAWPRDGKEQSSLIFNGGFEHDFANGGFDWRQFDHPEVSFAFDEEVAHSGGRSLQVAFNGESNLDFRHLVQHVMVESTRRYRFTAYLKSSELTTDSGVRFLISDPHHTDRPAVLTQSVSGTQPWTRVETEFVTGPQTELLDVVLRRTPSAKFDNTLKGTAWVDDVSLLSEPKSKAEHLP